MPFALDDLGVIFCKESIGLKKKFFQTSNIFSRGGFWPPIFDPLKKAPVTLFLYPFQHYIAPFGMYI